MMKTYFERYLEDILGLHNNHKAEDGKLAGVLDLLIELRKDARAKKDYATSDKIRLQLQHMGILLKDDKDGEISYTIA